MNSVTYLAKQPATDPQPQITNKGHTLANDAWITSPLANRLRIEITTEHRINYASPPPFTPPAASLPPNVRGLGRRGPAAPSPMFGKKLKRFYWSHGPNLQKQRKKTKPPLYVNHSLPFPRPPLYN